MTNATPLRLFGAGVLLLLVAATAGPEPAGFWVPAGYVSQADTLIAQGRLRLRCATQDSIVADFAPGSAEERFYTLSYLRGDVRVFNESPDASRSPFLIEGCALRGVDPFYHRIDLPFNRVPRWRGDVRFAADDGGATLEGARGQQLDLRHPVDARDALARGSAISPERADARLQSTLLHLRRPYSPEIVADFFFVGPAPVLAERADVGAGDRIRVNGFPVPPGRVVRLASGDWIEVDVGAAAAGDGLSGRPGVYTYLAQMGERARAASFVRVRDERVERLFPAARLRPLLEPFGQAVDLALQSIPGGNDPGAAIANADVRLTLDRELTQALDDVLIDWCAARPHPTRPRAASLLVMDALTGAVRAVPSCPAEDELRPYEPLAGRERRAFLRNQNLVPHPVGSAAKPLWAAALATTFPNLLDARIAGHPAGAVDDVLGCPLRAPYNDAHGAGAAVGLEEFIERSCNRYLVDVATAAFAVETGPAQADCRDELTPDRFARCFATPAATEQAAELAVCDQLIRVVLSDRLDVAGDRCQDLRLVHAKFPAAPAFGALTHAATYRDPSPGRADAADLGDRYRAGRYRLDAWSPVLDAIAEAGDTAHFVQTALRFAAVSPQATNLALNTVEELRTDWVNLLLGGENSRWSNFELAEALARLMSGRDVSGVFVDSVSGRRYGRSSADELPREALHPGARRRVLHAMERAAGEAGTARRLAVPARALADRLATAVPGQPWDLYVFAKTGTPAVEKFVSSAQRRTIERLYRSGDLSWDAAARAFNLRARAQEELRRTQGERALRWLRDDVLAPMAQDPDAFTQHAGESVPAHPLYFDGAGRLRFVAGADLRVSRQGGVLLLGLMAVPRENGRAASARSADWISACALDPTLRDRILQVPPADALDPDRAVALSIAVYLDDLAVGQGGGFAVELAQAALDDIGDYLEREVRRKAARAQDAR